MSYRKRPYSNDQTNNYYVPAVKRYKKYSNGSGNNIDNIETQDIWKLLERIRKTKTSADEIIQNSIIFMEVPNSTLIKDTIEFLLKYVSQRKLHYVELKNTNSSNFVVLKDFTLIDSCLVLPIIFGVKDKMWIQPYNKSIAQLSIELHINGTIFVPKNCRWSKDGQVKESLLSSVNFSVLESKVSKLSSFREFNLKLQNGTSLTYFINGINDFISSLKFGKNPNGLQNQFEMVLNRYNSNLKTHLLETSLVGNALFDLARVRNQNEPLIRATKKSIKDYSSRLLSGEFEVVNSSTSTKQVTLHDKPEESNNSRWNNSRMTNGDGKRYSGQSSTIPSVSNGTDPNNRPKFLTQDEIKQHCIGSIKASIDAVKKMPSDTIFKAYIKCPKQVYSDKLHQSLDNIRSKTNCNVVILHISNVHESEKWFKSLNIRKYTSVNEPPSSTIKVASVGGIGEYMIKALEMINKVMNS